MCVPSKLDVVLSNLVKTKISLLRSCKKNSYNFYGSCGPYKNEAGKEFPVGKVQTCFTFHEGVGVKHITKVHFPVRKNGIL